LLNKIFKPSLELLLGYGGLSIHRVLVVFHGRPAVLLVADPGGRSVAINVAFDRVFHFSNRIDNAFVNGIAAGRDVNTAFWIQLDFDTALTYEFGLAFGIIFQPNSNGLNT
jgi:hypothetical protein